MKLTIVDIIYIRSASIHERYQEVMKYSIILEVGILWYWPRFSITISIDLDYLYDFLKIIFKTRSVVDVSQCADHSPI